MKRLITALNFVALVNLLAMIGFVGWLWQSGRVSEGRIHAVRQIFSPTVADSEEVEAERLAAAREQMYADREREMAENPLPPAATGIAMADHETVQASQAARRMEDKAHQLLNQLERRENELRDQEARFDDRRLAWERATKEDRQRKKDEQFQKTVRLYESIPPKQARNLLLVLVQDGNPQQAVAYIDAMNPRIAAKIIRELKSDAESRLATDLLERLRVFGLEADAAQEPVDDRTVANAQPVPD